MRGEVGAVCAEERGAGQRVPDSGCFQLSIRIASRGDKEGEMVVEFVYLASLRIALPTWGTGDRQTDWSIAAAKGAKEAPSSSSDANDVSGIC